MTPYIQLELDSIVTRQVFGLKVGLRGAILKSFQDLKNKLVEELSGSFNLSERDVEELKEKDRLDEYEVSEFVKRNDKFRHQMREGCIFENFQDFLKNIPSTV